MLQCPEWFASVKDSQKTPVSESRRVRQMRM